MLYHISERVIKEDFDITHHMVVIAHSEKEAIAKVIRIYRCKEESIVIVEQTQDSICLTEETKHGL